MADIAWSAISGGSQVVRKSIEINASQNWVAPVNLAGNTVWLTGCAAGGSGAKLTASGFATGGYGGTFCQSIPVQVTAGATYAVVIPAGGAAVSTSTNGNSGGDLTFDSIFTLKGGSGGRQIGGTTSANYTEIPILFSGAGVKPLIFASSTETNRGGSVLSPSESVNGNVSGLTLSDNASGYVITGGAAGFFGNGTAATSNTAAAASAANSGSGGGSSVGASGVSGAGGSGKLIIEWDEFL